MKTVVVFQGGGALGAFGAGAWQGLADSPLLADASLLAVAGASIGAVNAALVVRERAAADRGAQAIETLWRERIATPSWPFFGLLPLPVGGGASTEQWNGFLTGMMLGNRGLFAANWPVWQPVSGLGRLQQPLHDRRAMWQLLETEFPSHESAAGDAPLLAVGAVDVMDGALRLFDSDAGPLTARHLAASSAIPLLFDPVEVDGRLFWDGEVTRDSLLPPLLQRLLDSGRLARDEALQLITIEQFPRPLAAPPASGAEIAYRALNLMQVGKLDPPAIDGINLARVHRIVREPLPDDGVSGQFDYSPHRIAQLMAEGRAAVARLLQSTSPAAAPRRQQPSAQPQS